MLNKYKIVGDTLIVYNRKDNREMLFDAEDFDLISKHTWCITHKQYAMCNLLINGKYKTAEAQRLLTNFPTGKDVDHRNGNTLDNRKENLFIGTKQDNMHNRHTCKGYSWNKTRKKWRVGIKVNNKSIFIGRYDTETEARSAYLEAKKIYHPTAPVDLYK